MQDGRLLTSTQTPQAIGSFHYNSILQLWNPLTLVCMKTINPPQAIKFLDLIQLINGKVICGCLPPKLYIWDPESDSFQGKLEPQIDPCVNQMKLTVLKDGRLFSSYRFDKGYYIRIWNNFTHKLEIQYSLLDSEKNKFLLTKGGSSWIPLTHRTILLLTNSSPLMYFIEINSGQYLRALRGHKSSIYTVIQLTDGRIASGSQDGTVRLWRSVAER